MPPFLQAVADLPAWLTYLVIGAGAAVENFIPPVPADTFVLLGAFLAARGQAHPWLVFLATWVCNVTAAWLVYRLAGRYGRAFFQTRPGRFLLHPRQLDQIGTFYHSWGPMAIFVSRFLPGFRAMVPVFAGVTHLRSARFLLPVASASAIWYGLLVYLGAAAGRNWSQIMDFFGRFSTVLAVVAGLLATLLFAWWWTSRRHQHDGD